MSYAEKLAARGLDPTRVVVELDPTQRRMAGRALHGNVAFDVPFISHIEGNLFQGGVMNGLYLPQNIKHLVSLYHDEHYHIEHELTSALSIMLYDSLDQALDQIDAAAAWVAACMDLAPVLVHCQAGLNRSSLVAARALMLRGRSADEAIALIRERRSPACLCNIAFEDHLRSL